MYCSTCGSLIKTELNYCNRCGARVDKLVTVEKSPAIANLSMATGFVGFGGLALTVGLIAILLKHGTNSEVVVMLALAFLATVFGISSLLMRQLSQMIGNDTALILREKKIESSQLNAPDTARLEEYRQPVSGVTENTTRTLEKELVE